MKTVEHAREEMTQHLGQPSGCTPCIAALAATLVRVARAFGAHDINVLSALRAAVAYEEQQFKESEFYKAWIGQQGEQYVEEALSARRAADTSEKTMRLMTECSGNVAEGGLYVAVSTMASSEEGLS